MDPLVKGFVLDAYAARSCPVKTHNLFDPTIPRPESPDESLGEAFHGGRAFEKLILDQIVAQNSVTDIRDLPERSWSARQQACLQAMERGDGIIVDAVLPVDFAGHRSGRVDLLVRDGKSHEGKYGYRPVEVKLQRILERRPGSSEQLVSQLNDLSPAAAHLADGWKIKAAKERTLLQMSHYWRMLEACGHATSNGPIVGIIGQDHLPQFGPEYVVTWTNLEDRMIRTFSRT
ncbi:MAG: hypothetical protein CR979_02885, partial [Propionibacterium sp.]